MRISGEDLARAALDIVTSAGSRPSAADLESIAFRSRFVLDNLNTDPLTTVGGVVRYGVPLAMGQKTFTWGPGGDVKVPGRTPPVDAELPSEVTVWSYLEESDEDIEHSRGGRLLTVREYVGSRYYEHGEGEPLWLYWEKTLVDGRYTFYITPPPDRGLTVYLYARVPKIVQIDLGEEYDLDPGRADYLALELAHDAASAFNQEFSPAAYARLRAARVRLANSNREDVTIESEPRYLVGLERYWDHWLGF